MSFFNWSQQQRPLLSPSSSSSPAFCDIVEPPTGFLLWRMRQHHHGWKRQKKSLKARDKFFWAKLSEKSFPQKKLHVENIRSIIIYGFAAKGFIIYFPPDQYFHVLIQNTQKAPIPSTLGTTDIETCVERKSAWHHKKISPNADCM